MKYYSLYLAQTYGEGNYGENTYACSDQQQSDGTCVAGATTDSNGTGGGLADTGVMIVAIATLACLIVFVSLVVRLLRRKPVPQEVPIADESDPITQDRGEL